MLERSRDLPLGQGAQVRLACAVGRCTALCHGAGLPRLAMYRRPESLPPSRPRHPQKPMIYGFAFLPLFSSFSLPPSAYVPRVQKPMNHGFAISDWSADLATAGAAVAGELEAAAVGSHAAGTRGGGGEGCWQVGQG